MVLVEERKNQPWSWPAPSLKRFYFDHTHTKKKRIMKGNEHLKRHVKKIDTS